MRGFAPVLVAFAIVFPAWAQVQPPSSARPPVPGAAAGRDAPRTGTAVLAGRVVSLENGRPLRRAVVRASSNEVREGRSVSTDADGRWEIKDLPAGRFSISVQKGGYVPLSYGQRRPFEQGRPVDLADGQRVDKLEVALPKGSVLAGRIVDEFGEPVAGARVSAMRHRFVGGQRRLMAVPSPGATDTTDDLGQYRLHGLSPGDYYVSAGIGGLAGGVTLEQSADRTGYAPTFYPGTPMIAEAQRVTLVVGQELPEINFGLAPTRVARISGTAMNSAGKPMANGMIMLTSPAGLSGSPLVGAGMTKADGSFTISNVAPGEYRLEMMAASVVESVAQTGTPGSVSVPESASLAVTVTGQDLEGIVLAATPTVAAAGRIVFEGTPPSESAVAAIIIMGVPDSLTTLPLGGSTRARPDGSFELKGLNGRRFLRLQPPSGWYLKSVRVNETDVTDTALEFKSGEDISGLEFVLTQQASTLTGTVQDAKGQAKDYVVVAFASDSRKWGPQTRFIRTARPDDSGSFKLTGLPAADYLVVALEYLEPGEEGDTELLERLRPRATAVSIAEGASKAIELRLSR